MIYLLITNLLHIQDSFQGYLIENRFNRVLDNICYF